MTSIYFARNLKTVKQATSTTHSSVNWSNRVSRDYATDQHRSVRDSTDWKEMGTKHVMHCTDTNEPTKIDLTENREKD
jgi:hypothetical protein